ncbi:MAG: tRNA 2-selenouridine(34) synthase MnmH [Bacteroidales bacterium]|nr:tRNA 2-selenouridine(34) synthase MnmH [Bacteroidales bacterium]
MNKQAVRTGAKDFVDLSSSIPIVDVRTPSEFNKGHIPGAFNIALFNDDERTRVGTVYKQQDQLSAIMLGLDIAGPKMSDLLKQGLKVAGKQGKLLLYCWRGGSRSASMAWLFSNGGIECSVLEGGYKAYRNYILSELARPGKMIVLGGLTGSGKTAILAELSRMGEQVVDLEGLACHKGSAFGALGQPDQPSSEHFDNLLFEALGKTAPGQRFFVEDESHNIGSVNINHGFFEEMSRSKVIALMPDIKARLPRLRKEYGIYSRDQLIHSVKKISAKLGGLNTSNAIEAIRSDKLDMAIEIVLKYYDRTYSYSLSQRPEGQVFYIESPSDDPYENALKVKRLADEMEDRATGA